MSPSTKEVEKTKRQSILKAKREDYEKWNATRKKNENRELQL